MNRREMLKATGVGVVGALTNHVVAADPASATAAAPAKSLERDGLKFWLESSLKRVYPGSSPGSAAPLQMIAGRNQKLSFQACFRNDTTDAVRMRCEVSDDAGLATRVRRVGFVPLRNLNTYVPTEELEGVGDIPGMCPDPLYPEITAFVGPHSNGVFWISLEVPKEAAVGIRALKVRLTLEDQYRYDRWVQPEPWSVEMSVAVDVRPLVIQKRKDFPATQWISADSIWEYYKIEPCSERFWQLAEQYIANVVSHGVNVIYTPIFNARHELLNRPAQLLKVKRTGPDAYEFDFSNVRRWVRLAMKSGAEHVEWTHFFTPAPTSGKHPQRIYEGGAGELGEMLWPPEISAMSETYRRFLEQFLPQFEEFLEEEKLLEKSFFHCADEPDGAVQIADYRNARALLKEIAPWMKVMDAMSDIHFATERLSDMPVPSIVTAPHFAEANCPAWVYFCCGPRGDYLQRLLDTPLYKIRMAGWLFYRLGARGFLHWGHNYWFVFCTSTISDPFNDAAVGAWPGLPAGDPFVVYPGPDGPLDSIRWEVFAESLQDYAILQSAGVAVDDPLFAGIIDYRAFPKSEEWIRNALAKVLDEKRLQADV